MTLEFLSGHLKCIFDHVSIEPLLIWMDFFLLWAFGQLDWLVKSGQHGVDSQSTLQTLQHEIKVFSQLLSEIHKFLATKKNPRSRFLLNIPDYVFQV